MTSYTRSFSEIGIADVGEVGGKNASLGEMFNKLSEKGIQVPDGFATTASAFWKFLEYNDLNHPLRELLNKLDRKKFSNLRDVGQAARQMMLGARMPEELKTAVQKEYRKLCGKHEEAVAVRSSATAEDLPEASFAGQHESYLNITGEEQLVETVQKCFASLFTDRAIKYREDKGFEHHKVALSVGIQKMVRSDKSCSGVAFTIEPETGFRDLIHISGVWGLGENLVQGTVTPDEFLVFKPMLVRSKKAIIQKKLGDKNRTLIYAGGGMQSALINIDTPVALQNIFVLNDEEILQLARWCLVIETHYGKPMDIEWAKDGINNRIYIIQARPETVQSIKEPGLISEYQLDKKDEKVLVTGQAIGQRIVSGKVRILKNPAEGDKLNEGEIVVTDLTSPDWDPVLKHAGAIVTNKGGRTSHASIVARELGVPAIVGCGNATEVLKDGQTITVSCCEGKTGKIYHGELPFSISEINVSEIAKPLHTQVMLIVGDPDKAFKYSFYPNDGVGLMRIEFVINHFIGIHPMALARYHEIRDADLKRVIDSRTGQYHDKKRFFIERLAQGIATVAAAFYPKDVIVRMSDFKTNEYANLLGGKDFEPQEENPMIGFRGASRYYHNLYREGFALECAAIRMVREEMGFENVKLMIPYCRTLDEADKVIHEMEINGLDRKMDQSLQIYMMAEIPANVMLAEKFAAIFDGFSIGSNDLTQLTLGIDRDSSIISHLFNERDPAAMMMIGNMIEKAVKAGVKIGLCGQAPSDDPSFARFLVQKKISSISFNPDALLKGIENIVSAEQEDMMKLEESEILN